MSESLPLEHLSASSLSLHMRCPRQWQDKYVFGNKGLPNSSLVIGSAVHLALSRLLKTEQVGTFWMEAIENSGGGIDWRDTPEKSEEIALAHVYHYWETIGKYLNVVESEQEFYVDVPGVDIPILGYIDIETPDRLIDLKTTKYFSRKQVRPNKEWIFQQAIYQLKIAKPSEVHVLTRSKADPVVVPDSRAHNLHFGLMDTNKTIRIVQDEWFKIKTNWEHYGCNEIWPGNPMHEWAGKYCQQKECCSL